MDIKPIKSDLTEAKPKTALGDEPLGVKLWLLLFILGMLLIHDYELHVRLKNAEAAITALQYGHPPGDE